MALPVQTFNQFVSNMATTLANSTAKVTNLASGSVAFAMIRAVAGNALALQQLAVTLFNVCRLATSTGADVDSFVADFGLLRLQAVASTGTVTLTRAIAGVVLSIPMGGVIQTPFNGIQFQLIADPNQTAYDPINNVYTFGAEDFTMNVTVQALVPGAAGNVIAGSITQIVSGLIGINSVSNMANFVNGADQESDAALRKRFVSFLASLAKANRAAIIAAIQSVQPNVNFQIIEYFHFDGSAFVAGFTVVADDGTGNAPQTFLNAVYSAVDAVRAAGIEFEVHRPNNVTVNVVVHVAVAAGGNLVLTQASVTAALRAYINTLGTGITVSYTDVGNVVQTTNGVFSYSGLTLNNTTADIAILQTQLAQLGTVAFS